MKKYFLIIFSILLTNCLSSQTIIDTLVIATKKYPLYKAKAFHALSQTGPVALPSEYKDIDKARTLEFKYKTVNDTCFEVCVEDKFGGEFTVAVLKPKNIYPYMDSVSHLTSIVDTIYVSAKEFRLLRPYIKSKSKKTFFCASTVDHVLNDTITIATHSYVKNGTILSFWQPLTKYSDNEITKLKKTTFILRELHYSKNNATFYLDRKFVIKIN